jgi:hypothetical protein
VRQGVVILVAVVSSVFILGCFKTTYYNLYAEDYVPPADAVATNRRISGWQSFFVFGWAPGEKLIPSATLCGEGYVEEIQTRRTFVQGLIAAFAGYYVNIYSPYTGKTVCKRPHRSDAPQP